jgi:hypothetical protein
LWLARLIRTQGTAASFAFVYMVQAGYDPRSMIDVMKILEASSRGPRPAEFMSTHPDRETACSGFGRPSTSCTLTACPTA